jgi:hypothetical protein
MTPARQAARAFYLAAKSELVRADQPHGVRAIAAIVKCDALPQYTTPNGRLESWGQVCRWVMRWNEYAQEHDMAQLELRVGPTISCGPRSRRRCGR